MLQRLVWDISDLATDDGLPPLQDLSKTSYFDKKACFTKAKRAFSTLRFHRLVGSFASLALSFGSAHYIAQALYSVTLRRSDAFLEGAANFVRFAYFAAPLQSPWRCNLFAAEVPAENFTQAPMLKNRNSQRKLGNNKENLRNTMKNKRSTKKQLRNTKENTRNIKNNLRNTKKYK